MTVLTKKQQKKEFILKEGISLLMLHGYHGTGLKLILDTVKIPKGSFYNYFNSKEDFTAEAIDYYIEPYIKRLNHYIQDPELDGLTVLKCYYQSLIEDIQQSDFKGGCLLGDMMSEIGGVSDVCRRSLLTAVKRYCLLLENALLHGQQCNVIRGDLSAKSMADLLFNSWQGALLRIKIEESVAPLEECCQYLLNDYFLFKP